MAIKSIKQPRTNLTFRLGRKRPVARCPRFSLQNYSMRSLPPPPSSVDYSAAASKALSEIYLNDKLGDCVIPGMAHVVGVETGNAGTKPFLYSNQQILRSIAQSAGMFRASRIPIRGATNKQH